MEQGPDFWCWFDTTQFSYHCVHPIHAKMFSINVTAFHYNSYNNNNYYVRLLTHAHCSIILLEPASSSGCSYDTYWLAGTCYLTVHMMQEESLPSDSTTSIVTSDASDRGGSCSAGTGGSSVPTTNEGV